MHIAVGKKGARGYCGGLLALATIFGMVAASGCDNDASEDGKQRNHALSVIVTPNGRVIDSVTAELITERACELNEYELTDAGAADDVVSYDCVAQGGGEYTVRIRSGADTIVRTIDVPASDFDLYRRHPPRLVEVEL
jgi:hypothetical protein